MHHRGLTWIPNKDDLEEDFPFKLGILDGIHVHFWVYISYCWNQWIELKALSQHFGLPGFSRRS